MLYAAYLAGFKTILVEVNDMYDRVKIKVEQSSKANITISTQLAENLNIGKENGDL